MSNDGVDFAGRMPPVVANRFKVAYTLRANEMPAKSQIFTEPKKQKRKLTNRCKFQINSC